MEGSEGICTEASGDHPQQRVRPQRFLDVVFRTAVPRVNIQLATRRAALLLHQLDGGVVLEQQVPACSTCIRSLQHMYQEPQHMQGLGDRICQMIRADEKEPLTCGT